MGKSLITSRVSLNRKWQLFAAALAAELFLGGCSLMGAGSDATSLYQVAKAAFGPSGSVNLEEAAAIPYASMGLRVGDSPQVLIVLATDQDGDQMWTSSSRISIIARNGRIVRTAGLGHDLGGIQGLRESNRDASKILFWASDFPELSLYAVPISCVQDFKGEESITILGQSLRTQRTEERCHAESPQLNWTFTNTYWRDPANGFAWKSVQHINPRLDAVEIEILRPPA